MEIDLETGAAVLHVHSKTHGNFRVLIDVEDWEKVSRHTWHVTMQKRVYYFQTKVRKPDGMWTKLQLHRLVLNAPKELQVDHIHHNYCDMRKSQLRLVTNRENQQNRRSQRNTSSRFKGVSWHKGSNKWCAQIKVDGKNLNLGLFHSEETAALAYNKAAQKLNNLGACFLLNDIPAPESITQSLAA